MSQLPMSQLPKIGQRVTYQKMGNGAGRNGWTGTVINVYPSERRFEVSWDDAGGEVTSYQASAFTNQLINELPEPDRFDRYDHTGYIYLLDGRVAPGTLYIVAGENGGQPRRVQGTREQAEEVAHRLAANSKSGQAYAVYRAVSRFQRQTPPVQRIDLE
jgi:hypothetical protein